jgi:hypothetical protein
MFRLNSLIELFNSFAQIIPHKIYIPLAVRQYNQVIFGLNFS